MQFGIFGVGDVTQDPTTGYTPSEAERIDGIVRVAEAADEVGLDVFGLGEHHNPPFVTSSPTTLLAHIAKALTAGFPSEALREVIGDLATADAVIAVTPVYKAGISGLFKAFVDILDNDLLVAKPVLLAGTAGTARHAMVVDDQMRPLFAFMRTLTVPTSVFAAPEDWADAALGRRITRASTELVTVLLSGTGPAIAAEGWAGYQHEFGGNATRSEKETVDVDFGSDLMRLATGGSFSASPVTS